MAITFSPVIKKTEQKKDGTWNVKIRVTSNSKVGYISTDYHLMKHQLTRRGFEIVDKDTISACDKIIEKYNKYILASPQCAAMTIKELMDFLKKTYMAELRHSSGIQLAEVADAYRKKLINENRDNYANSIRNTMSLCDKYSNNVKIDDITLRWLNDFQVAQLSRGLSQSSINLHLRNIRTLFNYAMDMYNDDENGIVLIKHYPFRKFRMKVAPSPAKRNLSADIIKKIAEYPDTGNPRVDMARDVFILSFCLCGMNTADLYSCTDYADGRISYIRQKTKRKGDKARISVAVPAILKPIASRYFDKKEERVFDFHSRYCSSDSFSRNTNKGLSSICEALKLDVKVTTYYARHSFATIARNECGASKDDVAICLTHSSGHDITDRYIAEDWSIIDRVQANVIEVVFGQSR